MPNKIGSEHLAVIKVVGVGGGGTNAVNRMVEAGVKGVEFIAVNTDRQALLMSDADKTIHIGEELTRGPGSRRESRGGRARRRRRAAPRSARRSPRPTWCSSPPARAAERARAPLPSSPRSRAKRSARSPVGIVTKPFSFEGRLRRNQAEQGIDLLSQKVDTLIVIPNDRLLEIVDKKTTHARRLPHRRRHAAPGHPGRHRPHHHPRPHQPRLRRHPHRHEGRGHGHDGHRHRLGREPRPRRRSAGHRTPTCSKPPSPAPPACCSPSPAAPTSRSPKWTRRPAPWRPAPTTTPTSSTARSSTRPCGDQVRITVIATGFKMNAAQQSSMDFSRKDLFASTEASVPAPSQPVSFSTTTSNGRFADEDYIPDFLKRQR